VWLGIDALKTRIEQDASLIDTTSDPLTRGTLLNLLSPHPWLFWIVVGGPILLAAWNTSPISAIGFLVAFFALLVGTKVVIAAIVAQGRERLSPRNMLVAQRIAGLLLIGAGIALTYEFGQQLLG
jgi:threonine/homoserine/homoserine lactone efflux protein